MTGSSVKDSPAKDSLMADSALFFPAGAKLVALPSWEQPRLLLEQGSIPSLWRTSNFYPAFRPAARAFKTALRLKTALRFGEAREVPPGDWALGAFVAPVLPGVTSAALLVGTPGPVQKLTVQLWRGDAVVGYLKYGASAAACERLAREHKVLSSLPPDTGPKPLKHGAFGRGAALVTEAVPGRALPARLPPPADVRVFLQGLEKQERCQLNAHPSVQRLLSRDKAGVEKWLQVLGRALSSHLPARRLCPVELIKGRYGTASRYRLGIWRRRGAALPRPGFLLLAGCHAALPLVALTRSRPTPLGQLAHDLPEPEAEAFVRLAAFHAYVQALDDGHAETAPLQAWRLEVFR